MNPEKVSVPTNENEVDKEQLRGQAKDIGEKVLDEGLRQQGIEKAPEGYLTAVDFASKNGISVTPVYGKMKELGIKGTRYKNEQSVVCSFLSPEQQQQIADSLDYLISTKEAPEGFLTARSLSSKLGIDGGKIHSEIKKKNIICEKYKDRNGVVRNYLSPEQQQQIIDSLDYLLSAEEAPDGYLTVRQFSNQIGISEATIVKATKKSNIMFSSFKSRSGVVRNYLSPEQQQQIIDSLDYLLSAEEAPDGYLTTFSLAKMKGLDYATVNKKVKQLGIERFLFKNKESGRNDYYLSPDQQRKVLDSLDYLISAENAPNGYLTVTDFASKNRISITPVYEKMDELGIEGFSYKGKSSAVCLFLSPEQQQQIADSLGYLISAEEAPEGYLTARSFADHIGTSQGTVERAVKKLGIKGKHYRGKTGTDTYLSLEQQQEIIESLDYLFSAEEVPDGYSTVTALGSEFNISHGILRKRVQELGLHGALYKNHEGRVNEYLSPEQQSALLDYIENAERDFSQTSIPENTIAFYFKKAGKEFEQGFRPDWLRNPSTGKKLEIDIFIDPPGIGVEYDGARWHQDVERDVRKDILASKSGYKIIHVREQGCPDLPDGSICIKREKNDDDKDLAKCIRECFQLLNMPVPDIDIVRDKKDIMAFMRGEITNKLDAAMTFEELTVAS